LAAVLTGAILVFGSTVGFVAAQEPQAQEAAPMILAEVPLDTTLVDTAQADSLPVADSLGAADSLDTADLLGGERFEAIGSGMASYYGYELAGNRTASGERFDPEALTAAHPTLPFGSHVRVTNTHNGKSVVVRINDRGPFTRNRIIDVSQEAARQLSMIARGTASVELELLVSGEQAAR
jgi:rare lipoprotein A